MLSCLRTSFAPRIEIMESAQSPNKLFATQHQPSTFEERGTTVPFTTPTLSCARVRTDERHHLVLLTPGFAGTQSVYVLPWRAIPELVTMTVHDRALHEAIQDAMATSPDTMRRQVLSIAATGLAGPEVQASARKALRDDDIYAEQIHAVLILFLLNALGIDVSALTGLDLSRADVLQKARTALEAATTPLGIDLETLYDRMGLLAAMLGSLGLASFGEPGRLRVMLLHLKAFQRDMLNRANRVSTEASAFFGLASEAAQMTITPADLTLSALDSRLLNLPDFMRNWDAHYTKSVQALTRLSWLLDGWDYVMAFAKDADDWSGDQLWLNLDILAKMLPLVPRNELVDGGDGDGLQNAERVQRRRVNALQDWRTGILDIEMARRLEAAKSAAMSER